MFCFNKTQCELFDKNDVEKNYAFDQLVSFIYHREQSVDNGPSFIAAGTSLQLDRFKTLVEENVMHSIELFNYIE